MWRDEIKTLYHHFHKTCIDKTCLLDYLEWGFPTYWVKLSWGVPTHKFISPLNAWTNDVTKKIRIVPSPLPQDLLQTNMIDWWLRVAGSHSLMQMTFFSCGHMKSHGKLKTLYLLLQKTYGPQTYKGQYLFHVLPVTKSYYHLITRSCSKWRIQIKIKIFILQHFRAVKLGKRPRVKCDVAKLF